MGCLKAKKCEKKLSFNAKIKKIKKSGTVYVIRQVKDSKNKTYRYVSTKK